MFDLGLLAKIVIVTAAIVVGVSSYKFFGMKEDNAVEQVSEEVIKLETGAVVDLSPDSK